MMISVAVARCFDQNHVLAMSRPQTIPASTRQRGVVVKVFGRLRITVDIVQAEATLRRCSPSVIDFIHFAHHFIGSAAHTARTPEAHLQQCFRSLLVLFVEPKINERIVANGTDAEPMAKDEYTLGVHAVGDKVQIDVVQLNGKPTNGKYYDDQDQHLDGPLPVAQIGEALRARHGANSHPFPNVDANLRVTNDCKEREVARARSIFIKYRFPAHLLMMVSGTTYWLSSVNSVMAWL